MRQHLAISLASARIGGFLHAAVQALVAAHGEVEGEVVGEAAQEGLPLAGLEALAKVGDGFLGDGFRGSDARRAGLDQGQVEGLVARVDDSTRIVIAAGALIVLAMRSPQVAFLATSSSRVPAASTRLGSWRSRKLPIAREASRTPPRSTPVSMPISRHR